jgi:hypothetical protein
MNKEKYLQKKAQSKDEIRAIEAALQNFREEYIQTYKPCQLDEEITIMFNSGREEQIVAKSFGIWMDDVVILSFKSSKDGKEFGPMRYISQGHGKVMKS